MQDADRFDDFRRALRAVSMEIVAAREPEHYEVTSRERFAWRPGPRRRRPGGRRAAVGGAHAPPGELH
ncbi:MAG: hypothetical protein U0802_21100 [Candidatus Binatia bacterium]